MNILDWLIHAQQHLKDVSSSPRLDVELLLSHVLGKPRTWVLTHPEFELPNTAWTNAEALLARAKLSEPIPYILGHWEFYGMDFLVSPDVLIPRPETELIVEHALMWLKAHPDRKRVADVGTGCGCIAITLATHLPNLEIVATDISKPALETAQKNSTKYKIRNIDLKNIDLLGNGDNRFDVICANLPYIPSSILKTLTVSHFEPKLALDGGRDGLREIIRLLEKAPHLVSSHALILCEIEASQKQAVLELSHKLLPFANATMLPDLSGKDRLLRIELDYENAGG